MAQPTRSSGSSATTTRWVDAKKALLPWAPRKAAWLVGVPVAALIIAGGGWYSLDRIQTDLSDGTHRDLAAAGIEIENLDVDFDHRDGTISGLLPVGMTVEDVRQSVDVEGIRVLDLSGLEVRAEPEPEPAAPTEHEPEPVPEPEPEAEPEPEPEAAPATGPTEVTATVADGTITLRGDVLTDAQRTTLVDAAKDRFGADNVTDELIVTGFDEATPGASNRIDVLVGLIAAIGDGVEGTGELSDTSLTFTGTAPDDSSTAALAAALAGDGGLDTTLSLDVLAPPVAEEVVTLQAEFDALAGEIRDNVVFGTNLSELSPTALATLDKAAALIQQFPQPVVQITGHTDSRGIEEGNQILSAARASAVADYIVSRGVDTARIRSNGAGELEPIANNTTLDGQAQNRRVELTALASFE